MGICCCQYLNTSLLLWPGVNFSGRKDHLFGPKVVFVQLLLVPEILQFLSYHADSLEVGKGAFPFLLRGRSSVFLQ